MLSIYGHKWSSHLGSASDGDGHLSDAAKTWQQGLAGVTVEQIKHGFDVLIFQNHDWPPSLPEFRRLCQQNVFQGIPTLDEVVSILVMVKSRSGSLVSRYRSSLALAISQHEAVDMHALRTAKTGEAKRMIKPVYDQFLITGWTGWPDYANEDQKSIVHEKPLTSKADALLALGSLKELLH